MNFFTNCLFCDDNLVFTKHRDIGTIAICPNHSYYLWTNLDNTFNSLDITINNIDIYIIPDNDDSYLIYLDEKDKRSGLFSTNPMNKSYEEMIVFIKDKEFERIINKLKVFK